MVASADSVFEFRPTATAGMLNGGGFVTGASGTDYSQQDAAQYNLTGVTSAGAGNVILSASAAADMVGNFARVVSGTNFTVGWFEITAVTPGVDITCATNGAGTAISTGVGANGVVNIGGALDLNSATGPDLFFESLTGGNYCWVKGGAYTLGGAISVAATLTTVTSNGFFIGYTTTRGDTCNGTNRPSIVAGSNAVTFNGSMTFKNIIMTGGTTPAFTPGTASTVINCKVLNNSATNGRVALAMSAGGNYIDVEAVSQNGNAISAAANVGPVRVHGCHIHDSDIGFNNVSTGVNSVFTFNIFECNHTAAFNIASGVTPRFFLLNNTFYGSEAKIGNGVQSGGATTTGLIMLNNIFYGFSTAISIATVQQDAVWEDYNDFYNNTTDRSNIMTGPNSVTTNPGFVSASQITFTTATTSGSVLTLSGGDFSAVTDNVDFLHIISGTGVTVDNFLITSHTATTLTVNNTLGTSSAGDVVGFVGVNHNLAITGAI